MLTMFSRMLARRSSDQIVTTTREAWTPSPAVSLSMIESGSQSEAITRYHVQYAAAGVPWSRAPSRSVAEKSISPATTSVAEARDSRYGVHVMAGHIEFLHDAPS